VDSGYGIYDHYDLGNYDQKGTVETRYGSRAELEQMIGAMHDVGISVYSDVVLNHLYGGDENLEANPSSRRMSRLVGASHIPRATSAGWTRWPTPARICSSPSTRARSTTNGSSGK
jgi:hypothetical protein